MASPESNKENKLLSTSDTVSDAVSPLPERKGPRLRPRRKRPFDKGLYAASDASPMKSPRKETGRDKDTPQLTDWEILHRGQERMREYRHYLAGKLVTPRQNLHIQKRMKEKEDLIASLELRIIELEKTSHAGSTLTFEGETDDSMTPTQRLLNHIQKLEAENDELKDKVSSLEDSESLLKQANKNQEAVIARRWSCELNISETKNPLMLTHAEYELKRLKHQVSELEKKVQSLQGERDDLHKRLVECEVKKIEEERRLQQKIDEAKAKQLEAEMECMNEQAKFWEHLASTPSMVVVESKAPSHCDIEKLQCVLDELKAVSLSHDILKKQAMQYPKVIDSVIKQTSDKIQEAIKETDEKNKELVSKYTREIQLRKCYHNQLVELRGNIRVFCRVRPSIKEDGSEDLVMNFDPYDDGVIMVNNKGRSTQFHLDKIFDMNISQAEVFDEVSSLVRSAIDGFNVCIFAYGQTGSGKTYTMEGPSDDPGVNQRALKLLYEETKNSSWQYKIEASMMEIYNETLRDLLNPDPNTSKLEVKMKQEGGLHVPGLVSVPVSSLKEVNKIFETGRKNRATASTSMNERSSRSHSLLCVTVEGTNTLTGSKTFGRLNLVDLAGSERVSKSQADGARLKEAQNINKSLSSLGDVISAVKNKHSHIPYRNSKLTYLLQESLGGDSKTLMILQISPVEKNVNESICTLTFGQRVRSAELGAATRKLEEGNKATPSSARRPNSDTPKSPTNVTPSNRTPILPKASTVPAKLNLRFK